MAEKDTSSLLIFEGNGYGDRAALRGRTVFAGGSWDARSNPREATSVFFFSFIVFLPFGFLLFIVTAEPFSFARSLRKHISSSSYSIVEVVEVVVVVV